MLSEAISMQLSIRQMFEMSSGDIQLWLICFLRAAYDLSLKVVEGFEYCRPRSYEYEGMAGRKAEKYYRKTSHRKKILNVLEGITTDTN